MSLNGRMLKEKWKLYIAYPQWFFVLKKIQSIKQNRIFLIGTPVHGNLGDHAIAESEISFFNNFFPNYDIFEIVMPFYLIKKREIKKFVNDQDIIVISGGGWMGDLWIHNELVIRDIVKSYPQNHIVIMPQTVFYSNTINGEKVARDTAEILATHSHLTFFAREEHTFLYAKNRLNLHGKMSVYFCPDMVLYGSLARRKKTQNSLKDIVICFRRDREKIFQANRIKDKLKERGYSVKSFSSEIPHFVPHYLRKIYLFKILERYRKADLIITDRLHAMLFAELVGTPCCVTDNRTGKVFGVAQYTEENAIVIKFKTEDELLKHMNDRILLVIKNFDRMNYLKYFEKMALIIKET